MTIITLVVPVFNEQAAVPLFYQAVRRGLAAEPYDIEILFVDDGSTDRTAIAIQQLVAEDEWVSAVSLTRNFGKESALLAGLDHAAGDAIIPIDVDLQDPIELIPQLFAQWQAGADVVLAKRIDRQADGIIKRNAAHWFYRFINVVSSNKIEENVGDFRLLSRKTVSHIQSMPERNVFMKGVMQWVGGRCAVVEYTRPARAVGQSKFNGWKLWNLALEGITSFSTVPLRVWTYVGLLIALVALFYSLWIVVRTWFWGNEVPGYASLMVALLFLGGVQLMGIGILGEYIGRIYAEAKSRPRYIVDHTAGYARMHARSGV